MPFPPMPAANRGACIESLRDISTAITRGEVSCILLATIGSDSRGGSMCGAEYSSDVALMILGLLENHMKCECDDPKCTTDLARISAVAILRAYVYGGDDKPQKGN